MADTSVPVTNRKCVLAGVAPVLCSAAHLMVGLTPVPHSRIRLLPGVLSQLHALGVPAGHFSHIMFDEAGHAEEPLALCALAGGPAAVAAHYQIDEQLVAGDEAVNDEEVVVVVAAAV